MFPSQGGLPSRTSSGKTMALGFMVQQNYSCFVELQWFSTIKLVFVVHRAFTAMPLGSLVPRRPTGSHRSRRRRCCWGRQMPSAANMKTVGSGQRRPGDDRTVLVRRPGSRRVRVCCFFVGISAIQASREGGRCVWTP